MNVFRQIDERVIHHGFVVDFVETVCVGPEQAEFTREVVRHPGAVSVVAVTNDHQTVLVRQYRASIDDWVIEIPAGKMDVVGEDPELTASRELQEEVGYTADSFTQLLRFHNSIGFTDEESFVFLATGLTKVADDRQGIEETHMEIIELPLTEALAMIETEEITDAKTILGLTWAAQKVGTHGATSHST